MASLWLLILQYSAFSQFGFWEENQNYYLDTGINVTCLPLTSAYQSICTGTTCSTKFKFLNQKGYSEIIYTLNIYYTDTPIITFSENGNKIQEQYLKQKWNLNTFQYCNSNYEVQYFKIFSSQTLNVNTLTFSITSDIPSKFIITTLKIYVHRCHKYCEICNPENQCIQCFPNFQLQDSYCKCQVQTPFLYQDQCIHKCPNGFYTSFFYCDPYNQLENIIFDGQANQFTFIKDFNTTNRVTSFMENGKQFAGLFFQNEAVIYSLPQPLETVTNLYLTIEIFIFNQDQPLLFSVKFDDYVYYQNSFTLNIYPNKFFVFESCSILGNSNCTKILYNDYIKQINKLKDITLYFNIPLQNSQTSWAISSFKLDKIETIPKAPCYKKLYYDECVQDCPPTSKQIGQVCQNITSEYPFAEIFLKGFTKDPQLEDLLPDKQKFLQLCNSNKICIYPFYKNQYIFGGHRKWSNQFYSQELNFQDKSHYKVKIYVKILLIDPLNDLDTLSIFIDDKHYSISKTHPNSTCINNIGSGACVKQEDVGTVATDYIIQIEIEIDHRTNSLNLGFRCNGNSLDFYCSFYDFIVLLAKCPFNCKKCTSSTNCIFEPGIALQDISYNSCPEYYYYYDGNCEPCSKFCKQCNQLKCLTCNENYEMIGESCICKYNRVIAQYTDCKDNCGFSCSVCLNNQKLSSFTKSSHNSTCHQCYIQEKKVLSGLECVCLDGYYMDQSTFFYQCKECNLTCGTCNEGQNCLSCNHEQNREISDNMCICKQGYYQIDNDNLICKQCNPNCKTCTNSTDQCTSCFSDQFQVLNSSSNCDCQLGYFEDENQFCSKCNSICETCDSQYACLRCDSTQFRKLNNNNNQCECKENYYENENNACLQCYYTCSKCNNSDNSNTCTQCPQTRMKNSNLLQTFECLCKIGYYDIGDFQCVSCQDLINPPQDHYCYSKCGDSIIQWNEECDDGNLNSRDECDQCYFPISSCTNNLTCKNCQQNKCIECIKGYQLNKEQICEQCADYCLTCQDSKYKCNECKYQNDQNNNCMSCSLSEGYQDIDNKCYSICGDGIKTQQEDCDDGNLLNNDGCDQYCLVEEGYTCHSGCTVFQSINMILQENDADSVYESKRQIFLYFDSLVMIQSKKLIREQIIVEPVQKDLRISNIEIVDNTNYNKSFNLIKISIFFQLEDSYICPQIYIRILNNTIIKNQSGNMLSNYSKIITVINFQKQSNLTFQTIQNINSLIIHLFYIMIGLAISSLFIGGFENVVSFFETLQVVSYLRYINITYPYNVQQFFQVFFITEIRFFNKATDFNNYYSHSQEAYPPPLKFQQTGYSKFFLINIISVTAIFVLLLVIFISIKIIMYYVGKIILIKNRKRKIKSTLVSKYYLVCLRILLRANKKLFKLTHFFPQFATKVYCLCQYNLNLAIFLQLQNFELSGNCSIVNNILSIICLLSQFYILFRDKQLFIDKNFRYFNEYLYNSQKESNVLRKILQMAVLVILYSCPYFQLMGILGISLFHCAILLLNSNLKNKNVKLQKIITEVMLSITLLLTVFLEINRIFSIFYSIKHDLVGWIMILTLSLVVIIQFIFCIVSYISFVMKKYKIIAKIREIHHQFFSEQTENQDYLTFEMKNNPIINFRMKAQQNGRQNKDERKGRRMITFSFIQNLY